MKKRTIKNILVSIIGFIVVAGGIFWAVSYSNSKIYAVYEKFAVDLGKGKMKEAYSTLHPNAQRGISFEQFKAAFGNLQPVEQVILDENSTIDKLSGKTISKGGCESAYTMKLVSDGRNMLITRFNFTPLCGR